MVGPAQGPATVELDVKLVLILARPIDVDTVVVVRVSCKTHWITNDTIASHNVREGWFG